jgi:1-aminocyclopropane-1-carboxylate deaminase/D-cysteine desulfhydrase-like pyridoxal-dependent ACC family enzyme
MTPPKLSRSDLEARIAALPRVRLACLPTPLEDCPNLTRALGGPRILVKRDDMTGLAFGGNKARQLEFLFPRILASGCDTIVAGAYTQSNWCRQITAAACRLGLRVELVLVHGVKGPVSQGNLLLDRLMGADVTVVDIDDIQRLPPLLEERVAALRAAGRKPFLVSPFGLDTLSISTIGYVAAMAELDAQLSARGIGADAIYLSGANMTPAGLLLGARLLGLRTRVMGISPVRWDEDRGTDIARIANAAARHLGIEAGIQPGEVDNDDGFVGPKYGIVTPECRAALRLAASTEGLILDPVYTGKAMAGLAAHIRAGRIGKDQTVVFVHTGGMPALFAYAEDLGV